MEKHKIIIAKNLDRSVTFAKISWPVLAFCLFAWATTPAEAQLKFNPQVEGYDLKLPTSDNKYWKLSGHDTEYKNAILKDFQDMLTKQGIPKQEQKWYTAQLYQENGAFDPLRLGDAVYTTVCKEKDWKGNCSEEVKVLSHYCSFGLLQYNACARDGMSAKKFLEKNPEWKTVDYQLNRMTEEIVFRRGKYGDLRRSVLGHNCPACANKGYLDSKAGYVRQIEKKLGYFTLESL